MEGLEELGSGPAPVAAEPVEATQPVNLDDLVGADAPPAAAAAPEAIEDGFFDSYTPAPVAPPPEPEITDPRVAWRKKNADALKAKDKEEAAAKKAAAEKAAAHLKKVQETRQKSLTTRKETNRTSAKVSTEAGVPKEGTSWEKVNALINYSSGPAHTKDVTRLKGTLIQLKTAKA